MLPGSTERAVTVSGKLDSIVECFKQVSAIMLEVIIVFNWSLLKAHWFYGLLVAAKRWYTFI